MKFVRFLLISVAVGAAIFIAYGSWRTSAELANLLTVGGGTAQGSGWPPPETAYDIGYVGDPKTAFGFEFEEVTLETELGGAPAWLVMPDPAVQRADTWAIVVHGIGGRRENGYRFMSIFRHAGIPTMLIAYRNDAEAPLSSEGLYAFGLTEWRDLEPAVEYALANGARSVVLLGESMGGGIVGQFMRQSPLREHVSALLFDAPALDFPAVLVDQMTRSQAPLPSVLSVTGMWFFGMRTGLDIADADVMDAVIGFDGPVFISHGAGDRIVPVETSDRVVEARTAPTEYLRTDADHILSFKSDPHRYRAAMGGFLATLPKPGGG